MTDWPSMPHNSDLEMSTIGRMAEKPTEYLRVADRLTPSHFWIQAHRKLYKYVREMAEDRTSQTNPDRITAMQLMERLSADGELEGVGEGKVAETLGSGMNAYHIDKAVDRLDHYLRQRQILVFCRQTANEIDEKDVDPEEAYERMDALQREGSVRSAGEVYETDEALESWYDALEERYQREGSVYDSTGYRWLDDLLGGGMKQGRYYCLAALPKMGKTKLALTTVLNLMREEGYSADIWYTDGPKDDCVNQLVTAQSGVHVDKLNNPKGRTSETDWRDVQGAVGEIKECDFRIYPRGMPQLREVEAHTKARARECEKLVVVVDYIQNVHAGHSGESKHFHDTTDVTRKLATLASDLEIVVLGLSQFNRGAASKEMPKPSDLRNTAQVEQDVNHLMIWHRPSLRDEQADPTQDAEGVLWHALSKHSDTGSKQVFCDLGRNQFYDHDEWRRESQRRQRNGLYPYHE